VFGEFAAHVTGEEDLLGREVDVVTERALHSRIRERVPRIR
jgi:predicted nucleotidyltransferase